MTDRLNECCPLTSRAEAKARGLKRYYTGRPCKHGHITERRISDGQCLACRAEWMKRYYWKNHERWLANNRRRYRQQPKKYNARNKLYRDAHREKTLEYYRRYYQEHRQKAQEKNRRYREQHRDQVREIHRRWRWAHQEQERIRANQKYASDPEGWRQRGQRQNEIRRAQIKHLQECGFFLPTDTWREKMLMLGDLKRLGVIKQGEWK